MTKPIYEILQNIMDNKKITVAETAKMCNLPDSTVRAIITRKQKSVALEVAFKLSQGLDVPLEVLNGESSDTNLPSKGIDPSIFAVKRKEMGLSPNDVSRRLIERGIYLIRMPYKCLSMVSVRSKPLPFYIFVIYTGLI